VTTRYIFDLSSADDPKSGFNHDAKPAATAASANGFGSPGGDDPKKDDEMSWVSRQAKKAFTKKQLYRKVPIIDWLPKYNLEKAVSDTIAGITVALTVIPQGIAYALVAGLPPEVSACRTVISRTDRCTICMYIGWPSDSLYDTNRCSF
jgi:hypothetical protein